MPYKDPEKQRAAQAKSYQNNKDRYIEKSAWRRRKNLEKLADLKSGPCVDCENTFPACAMDYDHREGEHKSADVSRLLRTRGWQTVLEEIKKCDLVCSNCHRIRTWKRANQDLEFII